MSRLETGGDQAPWTFYRALIDYHTERRTRRWVVILLAPDNRGRDYRCWTHGGAERLERRLARRTSRALGRLG